MSVSRLPISLGPKSCQFFVILIYWCIFPKCIFAKCTQFVSVNTSSKLCEFIYLRNLAVQILTIFSWIGLILKCLIVWIVCVNSMGITGTSTQLAEHDKKYFSYPSPTVLFVMCFNQKCSLKRRKFLRLRKRLVVTLKDLEMESSNYSITIRFTLLRCFTIPRPPPTKKK